jgi:hypothetical protein
VFGAEIINEDSYFFWTFSAENIPDPQLRILEAEFGHWLVKKYGTLNKALAAWKGQKTSRDNVGEGRRGFRPLRHGHTYSDRSALRFESEEPGKAKVFLHPAMDPCYDGKPSMISETTFNRPNRFRSEAPLFYAAYGALQDSDAIVHFALDSSTWAVKPNFFMQPWTLLSPAMTGQFPAAALIYRWGLISPGDELVRLDLNLRDLGDLKGTPLPQDAALDELRLADVPPGKAMKPGGVIDPLVHFAGRVRVRFTTQPGAVNVVDVKRWIDRGARTVTSTNNQLKLDYGKGVLAIDAPSAQGVSGALGAAGPVELADVVVSSNLELGHIVAVSLDDRPLAESHRSLMHSPTSGEDASEALLGRGQQPIWAEAENRGHAAHLDVMVFEHADLGPTERESPHFVARGVLTLDLVRL